jgi:hypothetical protein
MTVLERLEAKVVRDGDCWLWTGAISEGGYPLLKVDGRCRRAHRVAYELLAGPIPAELQLDHLCRIRHCVNPAHLEPVTAHENTHRGVGPIVARGTKTHCAEGHPLEGENLYSRPSRPNERACRICRRRESRERKRQLRAAGVSRSERDVERPRPDVGTSRPRPEQTTAIAANGPSMRDDRKGPRDE